ncbi:MAG TPA: hypothetical protein VFK69_08455 [Candidatus Eisenbacteria bacterium]|nr:hypothetical protein [Candidatus Eisenbacteria bacterium]
MMRWFALAVTLALAGAVNPARAQHEMHHGGAAGTVPAIARVGHVHHVVGTRNPAAQAAFDEGLALCFAFNHDEAVRAFQRAFALDSTLAMAQWGIAYASGPNINLPMDDDHARAAWAALQKAQALEPNAPARDRAYIDALAKRYSDDPRADRGALDQAWASAAGALAAGDPNDVDAAALHAEALLTVHPWHWWTLDGKPTEGVADAIAELERALLIAPGHIGLDHFYIHALEESPHPERALPAAHRLEAMAGLQAGHLVHMPSHIYENVGEHVHSALVNEKAVAVDRKYITENHVMGVYPVMYYTHNMHFAMFSHMNAGNCARALKWAGQARDNALQYVKMMPMVEVFAGMPLWVQVRFHRWADVLKTPDPGGGMPISRVTWHFARAMAYASTGDPALAQSELDAYRAAIPAVKPELWFGYNPPPVLFGVGDQQLQGAIAGARGDRAGAIAHWREAVAAEDTLQYDDPPEWLLDSRPGLGAVLLADGRFADAEQVFRDDLERHPNTGRALYGLMESLRGQGRAADANKLEPRFRAAWKNADTRLSVANL